LKLFLKVVACSVSGAVKIKAKNAVRRRRAPQVLMETQDSRRKSGYKNNKNVIQCVQCRRFTVEDLIISKKIYNFNKVISTRYHIVIFLKVYKN
jgi:hypothetical protein